MNHLLLPERQPRVVLFDMDGVLFDSMPAHVASWYATCCEYGIESKPDEFYLYEGQKGIDTIYHLYHRTFDHHPSQELALEIYHRKTSLFRETDHVVEIKGMRSFMEMLRDNDRALGVVTGSSRANALWRIQDHYGDLISENYIVTADDCMRGKPHAEPYLKGMERLGALPQETLIIENAPLGVKSAASSGAFTCAIMTGPVPCDMLRQSGANVVFDTVSELSTTWQQQYL